LQIHQKELNFVNRDYKLIVEFSHDTHWFCNMIEDVHGIMSNNLAMSKPRRWKDCIVCMSNKGQWTYAQIIPLAIASALLRNPKLNIW
jgi:hypothetical protein